MDLPTSLPQTPAHTPLTSPHTSRTRLIELKPDAIREHETPKPKPKLKESFNNSISVFCLLPARLLNC